MSEYDLSTPRWTDGARTIYHGDNLDVLRAADDAQFDACVTDPPYGLGFMGKAWDADVPSVATWREVLRVLKPGAFALVFAGTRTFPFMALRLEEAQQLAPTKYQINSARYIRWIDAVVTE